MSIAATKNHIFLHLLESFEEPICTNLPTNTHTIDELCSAIYAGLLKNSGLFSSFSLMLGSLELIISSNSPDQSQLLNSLRLLEFQSAYFKEALKETQLEIIDVLVFDVQIMMLCSILFSIVLIIVFWFVVKQWLGKFYHEIALVRTSLGLLPPNMIIDNLEIRKLAQGKRRGDD